MHFSPPPPAVSAPAPLSCYPPPEAAGAALSRRNAIEVRVTARGAESWVSAADKSAGFFRFLGQRLFQPPSPAHSTAHTPAEQQSSELDRQCPAQHSPAQSSQPSPAQPAQPSSLSLVKRKVSAYFERRGGGGSAPAPAHWAPATSPIIAASTQQRLYKCQVDNFIPVISCHTH